jgi:hypothetical protein
MIAADGHMKTQETRSHGSPSFILHASRVFQNSFPIFFDSISLSICRGTLVFLIVDS